MDDLALSSVCLDYRGKGTKEVWIGALAGRVEVPCYGSVSRTILGFGCMPALLATCFERVLEGGCESGECFRGNGMMTLDLLDERDNVFDCSGDFVDHAENGFGTIVR